MTIHRSESQPPARESLIVWLTVEEGGREIGALGTPTENAPDAHVIPFPEREDKGDHRMFFPGGTVLPPGDYAIFSNSDDVTATNADNEEVHQLNWTRGRLSRLRDFALRL